jgi:hypothetical protein
MDSIKIRELEEKIASLQIQVNQLHHACNLYKYSNDFLTEQLKEAGLLDEWPGE